MASQAAQTITTQAQTLAHLALQQTHALTAQTQSLFTSTKQQLNTNAAWSQASTYAQNLRPAVAQLKDSTTPAATAAASFVQKAGSTAVQYAKYHPRVAAVQALSVAAVMVPALVAAPALGLVGLGAAGPISGGLAASFQSTFGTPLLFSAGQSAAMGGSGTLIVNGIVQGGAVVVGGVAGWVARQQGSRSEKGVVVKAKL